MVEAIQEYQRNWHNHVEGMPPVRLPQQACFYNLIGR
jgi:hypothetical protein